MVEKLSGQQGVWSLIRPIGEGDAGEVWLATSADGREYVLKRPSRRSYGGSVYRQAGQIMQEGKILQRISSLRVEIAGAVIRPVQIKDYGGFSPSGGGETFIVLEKAAGFDMKFLSKLFQTRRPEASVSDARMKQFQEEFARLSHFPPLLVYRVIAGVAELLLKVHAMPIELDGERYSGVVWNDIKLDHIFWDPLRKRITIIDWGNAQLLGPDRVSADKRYSPAGDYIQFCSEMKNFLSQIAPESIPQLGLDGCRAFDETQFRRVSRSAQVEAGLAYEALKRLRREEKRWRGDRDRLREIQSKIMEYAELPDDSAEKRYWREVRETAVENWDERKYREATQNLGEESDEHEVKALLLKFGQSSSREQKKKLERVWAYVERRDWAKAFWVLCMELDCGCGSAKESKECVTLRSRLRKLAGLEPQTPLEILRRAQEKQSLHRPTLSSIEELISRWREEKPPPGDWFDYSIEKVEVRHWLSGLEEEKRKFERAVAQAEEIALQARSAWNAKQWEEVEGLLPEWLLRDPDRRRLKTLKAYVGEIDKRFEQGPDKLGKYNVKQLAGVFKEYQVSRECKWLEERLGALEILAEGGKSDLLLRRYPDLVRETSWLAKFVELERFYEALKRGEYAKAKKIADSSLGKAYEQLAKAFEQLEKGRAEQTHFQPPSDDDQFAEIVALYQQLRKLRDSIYARRKIRSQKEKIEEIAKRYQDWHIIARFQQEIRQREMQSPERKQPEPPTTNWPRRGEIPGAPQEEMATNTGQQKSGDLRSEQDKPPAPPPQGNQQGTGTPPPAGPKTSSGALWRVIRVFRIMGGVVLLFLVFCCMVSGLWGEIIGSSPTALPSSPLPTLPRYNPEKMTPPTRETAPIPSLVPNTAPTPQPSVVTALSPTFTPTPAWQAKCNAISLRAQNGKWGDLQLLLSQTGEMQYQRWQQACGWEYSYKQMRLEVGLLALHSISNSVEKEARLKQLLQNLYPGAEEGLDALPADAYIAWLRITLALCHLPQQLTETQQQALAAYRPQYLQFENADSVAKQVCEGKDPFEILNTSPIPTSSTPWAKELPGWPQSRTNCSFLGGQKHDVPRWHLSLETPRCPIPPAVQVRPTWDETADLKVGFCFVDGDTRGTFPLAFVLQRPTGMFGVRLGIANETLRRVALVSALPGMQKTQQEVDLNTLPAPEKREGYPDWWLSCGSAYKPRLILQPVWVGNLLFWRMGGDAATMEWIGEPQVWPALGGMDRNAPVEFYWAFSPDWSPSPTPQTPAAHLFVPILESERRK